MRREGRADGLHSRVCRGLGRGPIGEKVIAMIKE